MNRSSGAFVGFAVKLTLCLCALIITPAAALSDSPRALLLASASGDVATIRSALKAGVAVDIRDGRGRTPLLIATHNNHLEAARELLAAGADVNAKDTIEDTPFLYAGAEGRLAILRLILKAKPNLKDINRYGGTALIPAAHHGHVETVRLLLTTKINVNFVNKLGWTALLEAVILGNGTSKYQQIVKLLLDHKADPNIADRDGVSPLSHARKRGQAAIVKLLLAAGAK